MESKLGMGLAKRARSQFTLHYKVEMIRRIECCEKTIAELATETGLHPSLLGSWFGDRQRIKELHAKYQRSQQRYESQLGLLKRQMKKVTAERDILKKTISYFAKRDTRSTNSSESTLERDFT